MGAPVEGMKATEQLVLSSIMKNPDLLAEIPQGKFFSKLGAEIHSILYELVSEGAPITKTHFVQKAKTENVTGRLWDKLYNLETSGKHAHQYIADLKKYWAIRHTETKLFRDIQSYFSNKNTDQLPAVLSGMIDKISYCERLLKAGAADKKEEFTERELFSNLREAVEDRINGCQFYSTGDGTLDEVLTTGLAPGYITALFGPTGGGKSMFALHLINGLIQKKVPCVYFSIEMTPESQAERLVAMRSSQPVSIFYPDPSGVVDPLSLNLIDEELSRIEEESPFKFVATTHLSLRDVERVIIQFKQKYNVDYAMVFIDLATMLTDFSGNQKASIYEDAINRMHTIARELNCHFVNVVQQKRSADSHKIQEWDDVMKLLPHQADIKNSGALCERARAVISCFRPLYFQQQFFPEDPRHDSAIDIMMIQPIKYTFGVQKSVIKYVFDGTRAKLIPFQETEQKQTLL